MRVFKRREIWRLVLDGVVRQCEVKDVFEDNVIFIVQGRKLQMKENDVRIVAKIQGAD